jgi:hypothetical protein
MSAVNQSPNFTLPYCGNNTALACNTITANKAFTRNVLIHSMLVGLLVVTTEWAIIKNGLEGLINKKPGALLRRVAFM